MKWVCQKHCVLLFAGLLLFSLTSWSQSNPPKKQGPLHFSSYANSHWVSVHGDSRNSDYVPLSPTANVENWWNALEGAALFVGPVFDNNGNLYVPSGRGKGTSHLHAYRSNGDLLWETPPMDDLDDFDYGAVISAPIVDTEGNLYANDLNQLWSFSPAGDIRWVVNLRELGIKGLFITPIFSRQGWVGGISTDGKAAFFNRDTGAPAVPVKDLPVGVGKPSVDLPPGIWAEGLISENFRQMLWDIIYGRNMPITNTPAVDPVTGRIFITAASPESTQGLLLGIDVADEGISVAFSTNMGAGSGTSPAISPERKYVYAIDDNGVMVAIETANGKIAWTANDTMGQASPSIGPDGTIYSFNGVKGTIVAINGETGQVNWRQDYHAVAEQKLGWRPFIDRVATVDGLITVTDSGLWTFLNLSYALGEEDETFPQPRKIVVAQIDEKTGEVIATFPVRDSSGAFAIPDSEGNFYLTLTGTATSISYHGVNPDLPFFLKSDLKPVAGLSVFRKAR